MRCSKGITGILLAFSLVCLAIPASAQDERRQRGQGFGGPGFGGGGFGGAMRGGGGMGLAGLLAMDPVKDHLKLDEKQREDLKGVQDSSRDEMRKLFTDMRESGNDSEASREAMGKKMAESMAKVESKIEEILDPDQFDRLLGLFVQSGLGQALTHKTIGERLGLNESIVGKVREIQAENGNSMRGMFTPPDRNAAPPSEEERAKRFEEMGKKMQELRKESEEKMMVLLTADQKSKLEALKGEKFEFPAGGFGAFGALRGRGERDNNDR